MNAPSQPPRADPPTPLLPLRPSEGRRRRIFLGAHGLRVVWRLLVFAGIYVAIRFCESPLLHAAFRWLATPPATVTPWFLLVLETGFGLGLWPATLVMGKIEKRGLAAYGLPWRLAFGRAFWEGALWGFVAIGLVVGGLATTHGISLTWSGLSAKEVFVQGLSWCVAFVLVGITEEFLLRGYGLATLAEGIGFWPAAVIFSLAFGAFHVGDVGETYLGIATAIATGLVFSLSLRRTGNLWFAIGMHSTWSWSETFVYGVRDSGFQSTSHLLSGTARGPAWLSGGSAGPEGSLLALVVMILLWFSIARRFRHIRFPAVAIQPRA